jgi:hypothetical protein
VIPTGYWLQGLEIGAFGADNYSGPRELIPTTDCAKLTSRISGLLLSRNYIQWSTITGLYHYITFSRAVGLPLDKENLMIPEISRSAPDHL